MINMQFIGAGSQHAAAEPYLRSRRHDTTRSGQLRMQARLSRVNKNHFKQLFSIPLMKASTSVLQANERQATSIGQTATESANATRVLVLGSSIAGMLAAAAVAPYVDEVIVLDKDTMVSGGGSEEHLRQVCSFFRTAYACSLNHFSISSHWVDHVAESCDAFGSAASLKHAPRLFD